MLAAVPARERALAKPLFLPDRPGPLTGLHVIATGLGELFVDRLPAPRVALARVGADVQLAGDPAALAPEALRALELRGFIDAPERFVPLLLAQFPDLHAEARVISRLGDRTAAAPAGVELRRLRAADAPAIAGLEPRLAWIHWTLGGPEALAASERGFGAFVDGVLASVAVPFLVGERFEELGVVTEPAFRGRGLSPACASAVAADVRARGRAPSWSTSRENAASLAVAAKLGAVKDRDDVLYVAGFPPPASARPVYAARPAV